MDNKNEDTIVHQIEKNLSNNINENLFLSGRTFDNQKAIENQKTSAQNNPALIRSCYSADFRNPEMSDKDFPLVSKDYISSSSGISRAEYIRQAREACLRQLSNTQLYSRPYDINYMDVEVNPYEPEESRRSNMQKIYCSDREMEQQETPLENSEQELASYHSLIIRCVCAIVLFLCIFAMDKFNLQAGTLSNQTIQEYVTGNDALKDLENILVTWLK